MNRRALLTPLALGLLAAAAPACTTEVGSESADAQEHHTKILENVPPEASVEGRFAEKVRVYGYVVEAKAGAKITASLTATAGTGAPTPGAALDTVLKVTGPFESLEAPGPVLVETEDGADGSMAAPPASFEAKQDGQYLVSFSTWDYPGAGTFALDLSCDGTDFQCRRPQMDRPCKGEGGPLFIQGSVLEGDHEWDRCDVIVLEALTVPEGSSLTIRPGVVVKANHLGTDGFGTVGITVQGRLQAGGTADNPVAFTAFKEGFGWRGLTISSQGNALIHTVVEKADVGLHLTANATVNIEDALFEGVTVQNRMPLAGVRAEAETSGIILRSVMKGWTNGMLIGDAQELRIEDSVIRANQIGVRVGGAGAVPQQCAAVNPAPRYRDPIFLRTDIYENTSHGIALDGTVLLQVTESNIVRNGGHGLLIGRSVLHAESFLRSNNIHDNGGGTTAGHEIRTFHQGGVLDVSGNYWVDISDPELSNNWAACTADAVRFTGFSPTPLRAGPRLEVLCDRVKSQSIAQQQQQ